MTRPLLARIHLNALRHNLALARAHAPRSRAWAVIKANGYGHGTLRVAQALAAADGLALLHLNDAVLLREAGISQPLLLLEGFFEPDELPLLARHHLAPAVHCADQIDMLERAEPGTRLDVFLKINSGMNRLGFSPEAFPEALRRLRSCPAVETITLMTHFATADSSEGVTQQLACFDRAAAGSGLPHCLANSAAVMRHPETHRDAVRPGIMLYGSTPFQDESAQALGLRPAMTLESRIIAVQTLQPGEAVGYGHTFRADRPMRLGTVACGYADGYPRHAPTGTPVRVEGRRTRLLGCVSMDMLSVDLTDLPEAGAGSAVILWGEGLSVDEVALAAGTIGYELLTGVAPRVPLVDDPA